jgi:hypothetical protein
MDKNSKIVNNVVRKLKEMSAVGSGGASFSTGNGPQYATPFAFNPDKKAKGAQSAKYAYKLGYKLAPNQPLDETNPGASLGKGPKAGPSGVTNNMYVKKFGYKPVNAKKLAKNAKWVDTKYLWGEDNMLSEDTNVEEYADTLGVESPELKKFIIGRVLGFDKLENKLNELLPLLQKAKQKTMDSYKQNPNFSVIYGTDIAADYLDDLIEMFKD